MTDEPKTSEQPSGHLRLLVVGDNVDVLQQLWYITTYHGGHKLGDITIDGLGVTQREEWRDVPVVRE